MARERSEPRKHFWRILFERSERSERSESCAGPWTRAPQGSRSAAQAASSARRDAPGQPFTSPADRCVECPQRTQPGRQKSLTAERGSVSGSQPRDAGFAFIDRRPGPGRHVRPLA